jgi:integrase
MDPRTHRVREFYVACFVPLTTGAAAATLREYEYTLRAWERWTANPAIADVDSLTLAQWKAALATNIRGKRGGPASPATVNKHLRHLQAILDKAGPPGPHNRDAMGLIPTCPWTRPLRTMHNPPVIIPLPTLGKIYTACDASTGHEDVVTFPRIEDVTAAAWWQAYLVTSYNCGFRRGAMSSIRMDQVNWIDRTITVAAAADKTRHARIKPFNEHVLRHLLRIRTHRELLFPWPHAPRDLYNTWHAIQTAAGLPTAEHFHIHDLKRTCGTQWSRISTTWATRYMLDHAQADVSGLFYISPFEECQEKCRELPQPAAWSIDQAAPPRKEAAP